MDEEIRIPFMAFTRTNVPPSTSDARTPCDRTVLLRTCIWSRLYARRMAHLDGRLFANLVGLQKYSGASRSFMERNVKKRPHIPRDHYLVLVLSRDVSAPRLTFEQAPADGIAGSAQHTSSGETLRFVVM